MSDGALFNIDIFVSDAAPANLLYRKYEVGSSFYSAYIPACHLQLQFLVWYDDMIGSDRYESSRRLKDVNNITSGPGVITEAPREQIGMVLRSSAFYKVVKL